MEGDPKSLHAANYEESEANPYSKLPDPLSIRNEKTVRTAEAALSEASVVYATG